MCTGVSADIERRVRPGESAAANAILEAACYLSSRISTAHAAWQCEPWGVPLGGAVNHVG